MWPTQPPTYRTSLWASPSSRSPLPSCDITIQPPSPAHDSLVIHQEPSAFLLPGTGEPGAGPTGLRGSCTCPSQPMKGHSHLSMLVPPHPLQTLFSEDVTSSYPSLEFLTSQTASDLAVRLRLDEMKPWASVSWFTVQAVMKDCLLSRYPEQTQPGARELQKSVSTLTS